MKTHAAPEDHLTASRLEATAAAGASLLAAREHDRAHREELAARFQRPIERVGARHHSAASLIRVSLSMTGRMLLALVVVMVVSLYTFNSPMEATNGIGRPPQVIPFGWYSEPTAADLLLATPYLLSGLFAGLAVLFVAMATVGLVLRAMTALGLRFLRRWAHNLGVEVSVSPS